MQMTRSPVDSLANTLHPRTAFLVSFSCCCFFLHPTAPLPFDGGRFDPRGPIPSRLSDARVYKKRLLEEDEHIESSTFSSIGRSNLPIFGLIMISVLSVLLLAVAVNSQAPDYRYRPDYYEGPPKPYAFSFNNVLDDGIGQIARTETADGSGRVQGSYSLANDEGHTRVVEYIADQDGFRAFVRTNEPGTDNQNPADVVIESSSPFANRNYQGYAPANALGRRPILNAAVPQPAAPEVVPVAPENVIPPVNRPVYRRPPVYRNYRPRAPGAPY